MGKQDSRPFFSIVMPTYGVEAYIAIAIEAVQTQEFGDWELIVVDDCSLDASAEIAQRYAAVDSRIRIVHHEVNQGLSAARNSGIAVARGRYVWMPDSDDTYEPQLLSAAYDALMHGGFDAVWFGHVEDYYDATGDFLYSKEFALEQGGYATPNSWHGLIPFFEQGTHYGYAWNKIYSLDRIKAAGLSFEKVRLIEDIVFNIKFFQDAESIAVLPGVLYRYAKRKGRSLTNANAFGSEEYYALHRRRIQMLRDQFDSWGVLDESAGSILGGLYGRYILSAAERNCYPQEKKTHASRIAWLRSVFADPLCRELLPQAAAYGSKALAISLKPIKSGNACACAILARIIYFVHANMYTLFTRVRSGR